VQSLIKRIIEYASKSEHVNKDFIDLMIAQASSDSMIIDILIGKGIISEAEAMNMLSEKACEEVFKAFKTIIDTTVASFHLQQDLKPTEEKDNIIKTYLDHEGNLQPTV